MNKQTHSFNQALLNAMENYATQTCFQIKRGHRYQNVTYRRFQTMALSLAKFFHNQGMTKGQRVAIIADNSLEWMAVYVGCLLAGGVVVPLRTSLSPSMLDDLLADLEAWGVVMDNKEYGQTLLARIEPTTFNHLPHLKTILIINDETSAATPPNGLVKPNSFDFENPKTLQNHRVTYIDTVLNKANSLPVGTNEGIRLQPQNVTPQNLASIHYVTGHNGQLVGVMFNQAKCLAMMRSLAKWFILEEDDLAFTMIHWSEFASLLTTLHYFLSGIPNVLFESYETISENMQQTSPTIMLVTPYFLEKLYEAYMGWVANQPESSQKVFQWAVAQGKEYRLAGENASPKLRQEYARADLTFFSQMRGSIGGRIRSFYATGALLSYELIEFFGAIGLPVLNIYNLTEAGGFPTASQLNDHRPGSCGHVTPGFEVRISSGREIQVRGPAMMSSYWQEPEETEAILTADGWLRTGDVGHLDEEGYLYITGYEHNFFVLSNGRKILSTAIENALIASPFISQAAVFGDGKQYVSAMIVPDLEALKEHFKYEPEPIESTSHLRVKALLDDVIGTLNSQLDRWEQIKEYNLLDQPLTTTMGELTPSMKISRHVVAARYAPQIEAMYPVTLQLEAKDFTHVQVDPERLRELLEKENILDAWMEDAGIEFLFRLARDKQIDAPSMVNICDIAASIAQMETEEKPLSTALIVGDPIRIARVLPPSQIQLLHHDHVRRMRKVLVTLATIVDGLVLGYVVDKYGYVRGIYRLEIPLNNQEGVLLGPRFRQHAAISQQCDAVVFFVPIGGHQVRVFANGQLVGRYSNGDWSPDRISQLDQVVMDLVQKKYNLALLQRVLRCAFQMSEENLGAIFLIGEANAILARSDDAEITSFATIISAPLKHMSDQELINFAKQDGATVIDAQSQFRGCMVLLRPAANTRAEIGPGKGSRHSSAAKMSAEANCLAITVSQDGPITVYSGGRQLLSM